MAGLALLETILSAALVAVLVVEILPARVALVALAERQEAQAVVVVPAPLQAEPVEMVAVAK